MQDTALPTRKAATTNHWSYECHNYLWPPNKVSHLVIIAHQGPTTILWSQKSVHQHRPPKREMEFYVFLEVSTKFITVQIVAEREALSRN